MKNVKKRLFRSLKNLLPILATASLIGCAAGNSRGLCSTLTLHDYSRAQQSQVADELGAAPDGATWPTWMRDYAALRAEVRACKD